jgi:CPA2 family monovalent cation:H+ antiporter-2
VAAPSINLIAYSDALIVLGTAGLVVPLVRHWGLPPVLAFLGVGALLGPRGLGSFVPDFPPLFWFTVTDARSVSTIADLGIVFLLFLIGLELSFQRLLTMRRLVFGLGVLQVLISAAIIAGIARIAGLGAGAAIVIGAALALSSTAIVIEILASQGRMKTSTGRTIFSVLLAQDLAVVPLLLLVTILGGNGEGPIFASIGMALGQTALALAAIVVLGRLFLKPLFRLVTGDRSSELFVAAILFVIVATGVVAALAGLSMALGAFVAGLLLSDTEYRKAIESIVEPFKGLLLGVFFFTVGMNIDIRELIREPVLLLGVVAGLIVIKGFVMYALARLFHLTRPVSVEAALLLAPGGEFAFVAVGMAATMSIVPQGTASFVLAVTSLTMVLIPLFGALARRLEARAIGRKPLDPELRVAPAPTQKHAIIVGHGRFGQVVADLLRAHKIPYIATDNDAISVSRNRKAGGDLYYGEATDPAFLNACGLAEASGVIITIHSQAAIDEVVRIVRAARPDIPIVSRARDEAHARHLYAIGVTDAVPETIEASLQLSEAALVGIGVPMGKVIASIHDKRDDFRRDIQRAATAAGQTGAYSLKAKSEPTGTAAPVGAPVPPVSAPAEG